MRQCDSPPAPEAPASVHQRTLLDRAKTSSGRGPSPLAVAVYPDAAEAVIYPPAREREQSALEDDGPSPACSPSAWADLSPDERAERNWERANGRAFSESRRYFVSNRLRYQWVLTFSGVGLHGPDGRAACLAAVALFVRRFHREFGDLPYWFSPELHPKGHGWHVNFLVPSRLPIDRIAALWEGRPTEVEGVSTGFVWVSDKTKDPRVVRLGLPFVIALRLAALYACKYASKDWSPENVPTGAHRFVAASGFKPRKFVIRAMTMAEALCLVEGMFGGAPESVWRSGDRADWDGPPVLVLRWSEPMKGGPDG